MKFEDSLGIDVSKNTIDVCLYSSKKHHQFENTKQGFKKMLQWLKCSTEVSTEEIIFCFEHTGLYSMPLSVYLTEKKINFSIVPALEIKKSMGLVRGKNDRVDAFRIAEYAYLRRNLLKAYKLPSVSVLQLQKLLSLRENLIKQKAQYQGSLNEYSNMLDKKYHGTVINMHKQLVKTFTEQINKLEEEIRHLINQDKQMCHLYRLITSVHGVGFVLATHLLVTTNCFTLFDNSRKYACYAGLAPFERQSGTSIRGRTKVSHFANKKIKALTHMAAMSSVISDPELKAYYQRKVAEGKSKMSTLNIIRNKIIHRVFAVVERGTPYVSLHQYAV